MKISVVFFLMVFFAALLQVKAGEEIKIGAQVYIEPGQSEADIKHYFKLLKEHNMTVCRIRLDESHVRQPDGSYDFSLYDTAFKEAEKNGVMVFATIFPANVLTDTNSAQGVGGFKFPNSDEHLQSIARYIEALVTHFKTYPALAVWVLQNEPGVAGNMPETKFAEKKLAEWRASRSPQEKYNDFMQIHYEDAEFIRDFTTWYLRWLSREVREYDKTTDLHVNPHMIFSNLADYDFTRYQEFLSHVGASMHPSWHFGCFDRSAYSLAMAANCEIMRTGAGHLPFWVTELQGGNNNFSGYNPLMPTPEEIAQWMWTAIASGTEGIIFWTLNPRATGFEAGEWALIDFQKQPTERLSMAGKIAGLLNESTGLKDIEPVLSDVYLLYSPESLVLQRNSVIESSQVDHYYAARQEGAHIKSLLAYYRVLEEKGLGAQIFHMEQFDWEDDPKGKTIVLANMAIVPRSFYKSLISFVKGGGKLIVSGQTAHFDEYVYNVMYDKWPLNSLFGSQIREFRANRDVFELKVGPHALKGHFLKGIIRNKTGQILGQNSKGEALAVRHIFGKGEVIWVPSMLGLADWENRDGAFSDFVMENCGPFEQNSPFSLSGLSPAMMVKHFRGMNGTYSLIINKTGKDGILPYRGNEFPREMVFHLKDSQFTEAGLFAKKNDCLVVKWP